MTAMTIPTARDPREVAATAAAEWLEPLNLERAPVLYTAAKDVAAYFAGENGHSPLATGRSSAYVDLQPGNGTAYRMHLLLLPDPIADSLGYGLVVTLPDFNTSLVLDPYGFHVPWYIAEKVTGLNEHGHRIIAAFTTVLSAHLDHLRSTP